MIDRRTLLLSLAALPLLSACDEDEAPAEQVAYFKDDANHRVMAFRSEEPLTAEEAQAVFDDVPHTPGTTTRAMIFSGTNPSPGDDLTLAANIGAAMILTANPPYDRWDWALAINPRGERSIRSQN